MSDRKAVNLNSINLVKDELLATISQASSSFETFLVEKSESHLQACINETAQIAGTLKLLQIEGADFLALELQMISEGILADKVRVSDKAMEDVGEAFLLMPAYIEYIKTKHYGLPALLLPLINNLRAHRREALLSESFFSDFAFAQTAPLPHSDYPVPEDLQAQSKRFRHMYQVGLLAIFKGESKAKLHLMHRAVSRMQTLCGANPGARFWWLAAAVLEVMVEGNLAVTQQRKRILGQIEKQFRLYDKTTDEALAAEMNPKTQSEFLYLVSISGSESETVKTLLSAYGVTAPSINDKLLQTELAAMVGPSAATVQSMSDAINEEIRSMKDVLEVTAGHALDSHAELEPLIGRLSQLASTLHLVGLPEPSKTLVEQSELIKSWVEARSDLESEQLLEVADALLYVESTLKTMLFGKLSADEQAELKNLSRQEVIASSHIAEAEMIVIKESQTAISMAKRAISSYVESNFDLGHIANVASTLDSVRGGLIMLNKQHAADVLTRAGKFIETKLEKPLQEEQSRQLLDTLADSLVSLEYYLMEMETQNSPDESILDVADESLAALGFGRDD